MKEELHVASPLVIVLVGEFRGFAVLELTHAKCVPSDSCSTRNIDRG